MAEALKEKREGLSAIAYNQIKTMILEKEFTPGQFINEAQLQELLGLGRTPVREAVLALARDQLVTVHPRKGIEVAAISPKAVHDIFEVRSILEPIALQKCIHIIDLPWALEMRAIFVQHAGDVPSNSPQAAVTLADLDNQFHLELLNALHNQYANQLMRSFVDYLTLIRSTVTTHDYSRFQASNREHIAILDAILEQDAQTASQRMSDHIQLSYQEAINAMMHTAF
ncbi:MAG: GntR family transcriptional regulator [Oscillospiraceae bacterium]